MGLSGIWHSNQFLGFCCLLEMRVFSFQCIVQFFLCVFLSVSSYLIVQLLSISNGNGFESLE